MSSFIESTLKVFQKYPKKIVKCMIIVLIFVFLFPSASIRIKDILISYFYMLIPKSFMQYFDNLQFYPEDLLFLWSFLLVTYMITMILTIIEQFVQGYRTFILEFSGEYLFTVNATIFIGILIYNTICSPGIKIYFPQTLGFYECTVLISASIFIASFVFVYCNSPLAILRKINHPLLSTKQRVLYNIIYIAIVSLIFSKIIRTLLSVG